jgi:hypothetical protein
VDSNHRSSPRQRDVFAARRRDRIACTTTVNAPARTRTRNSSLEARHDHPFHHQGVTLRPIARSKTIPSDRSTQSIGRIQVLIPTESTLCRRRTNSAGSRQIRSAGREIVGSAESVTSRRDAQGRCVQFVRLLRSEGHGSILDRDVSPRCSCEQTPTQRSADHDRRS